MFTNLNHLGNAKILQSNSAEGLRKMIEQITVPVNVIAFYGTGGRHYFWFIADVKIKNKKRSK